MTTIPRKDAAFIAFNRNLYERCVAKGTDWGFTTQELQEFSALTNEAEQAYEANINPTKKNKEPSARKATAFKALKEYLATLVLRLRGNMKVTETDLRSLGLPSRVHHAHWKLPRPSEVLDLNVTTGKHLEVDVHARIPEEGHPTEYLKRHGLAGILLRFQVDGGEWQERYLKRTSERLTFSPAEEAKYVTITGACINPSLEAGPFCPALRVLIN